MTDQYATARDEAERAIREAWRLGPSGQQSDLWCAILDRLQEIDKLEDASHDSSRLSEAIRHRSAALSACTGGSNE